MQRAAAKKKRAGGAKKSGNSSSGASIHHKGDVPVQLISTEHGLSDDERDNEGLEGYKMGGYHPVSIGDSFNQHQYVVLKKLGWGHFSTVWLVKNKEAEVGSDRELLALKVQKSSKRYTDAAKDEIQVLVDLMNGATNHPVRSKRVVQLYDNFFHLGPHGNHVCFCFETLGENLLVFIKRYNYQGIPRAVVREICLLYTSPSPRDRG